MKNSNSKNLTRSSPASKNSASKKSLPVGKTIHLSEDDLLNVLSKEGRNHNVWNSFKSPWEGLCYDISDRTNEWRVLIRVTPSVFDDGDDIVALCVLDGAAKERAVKRATEKKAAANNPPIMPQDPHIKSVRKESQLNHHSVSDALRELREICVGWAPKGALTAMLLMPEERPRNTRG